MSTATKVVKTIYSKLVKEQQTQADERSNDWRKLVQETAESKESPAGEVIQFLGTELGMDRDDSIELFRHDVEAVRQYNQKMTNLRRYEAESKAWHQDISIEEAKQQIEALEKEVLILRKKLHREDQVQQHLGSHRTVLSKIVRENRRLFDRPDKSGGWLDLSKFPTKYKA